MSANDTPEHRPSPSAAEHDNSDGAEDNMGPGEETPGLGVIDDADQRAAPEPNEPA